MSKREDMLVLLRQLQQNQGYLSQEAMLGVAKDKDVSLSEVYSVASFYSFFQTKPKGKYTIRLCKSLPCYMQNSTKILAALKDKLNIGPHGTSEDKKFSLELVNCIGACDQAPAMLINDKLYGNLTAEKIGAIIDECK